MKTSSNGLALIRNAEGEKLTSYPDPGTGGAPWTIGVGHTGPDVHPGMTITQAQCDALLAGDCVRAEVAIHNCVTVPLSQNQFDALVSWTFNCGAANLRSSTLLTKLNAGDYAGAEAEFVKWDKAAGRVLPGLLRRRQAEAALFAKP